MQDPRIKKLLVAGGVAVSNSVSQALQCSMQCRVPSAVIALQAANLQRQSLNRRLDTQRWNAFRKSQARAC